MTGRECISWFFREVSKPLTFFCLGMTCTAGVGWCLFTGRDIAAGPITLVGVILGATGAVSAFKAHVDGRTEVGKAAAGAPSSPAAPAEPGQ